VPAAPSRLTRRPADSAWALSRAQTTAEAEAGKCRHQTRRAAEDLSQLRDRLGSAEYAVVAAERARADARDAVTAAQTGQQRFPCWRCVQDAGDAIAICQPAVS
jgi:hypothetical protein